MSPAQDARASTDADGVRHIVLDDDDLDVVELVLGGAVRTDPARWGVAAGAEAIFLDLENNPVAHLEADHASGSSLRPLGSMTQGAPSLWDPALRRPPAEVRAALGAVVATGSVLAVVIDDVPTLAGLERITERTRAPGIGAVLCVVPASRRARDRSQVSSAGLLRASRATADAISTARPELPIVHLILPWPRAQGALPLDLDEILTAFGATSVVRVRSVRGQAEDDRVAAASLAFEQALAEIYPGACVPDVIRAARHEAVLGAVVLFTGLSGSGKSTIARALRDDLLDGDDDQVTVLDGDVTRRSLSSDLGFDPGSREANIDRIAYVCSLLAAQGGIAIAAPIAPMAASRRRARVLAERDATFLLVHVSTPLAVCEARDRKGLYARARAGEVADFTGISSPYEVPDDADVVIDTSETAIPDAVRMIRAALDRVRTRIEPEG